MKGLGASAPSPGDTGISSVAEAGERVEEGVCPLCRGAGFVRKDVPLDDPDFGRAFPCQCVLEEKEEQLRSSREYIAGILFTEKAMDFLSRELPG